jgi:hypothetical protein
MSDRQNDVLARIDAETAKCICGRDIPTDGPSLDYCSDVCQYGYTARQAGAVSELEGAWRISHDVPDGRTLNEQVAQALAWGEPIGEHFGDAMRQHAGQEDNQGQGSDTAQPMVAHLRMVAIPWRINPAPITQDALRESRTRVMWVQDIANPGAPTAAELGTGVTIGILDEHRHVQTEAPAVFEPEWFQRTYLTREQCARALAQMPARIASIREAAREWEDAFDQLAATTRLTPEELGPLINRLREMGSGAAQPLTGNDFRRRALEHQQNRGTGPKPNRRIPPRDLRR